ncbi:MAG: cryptochrome/photolyase family protein [Hyphomicrobium sp.]
MPQNAKVSSPNLIPILGDQLSLHVSSLKAGNPKQDIVVMAEVAEETSYVPHHKKKIAFILSAMRHFAEDLKGRGWRVDYVKLDDPKNQGSLTSEVSRLAHKYQAKRIIITEPGEWRVLKSVEEWKDQIGVPVVILADTRFVMSIDGFSEWSQDRNSLRMEFFYREMRKKTGLLMEEDEPIGGQWNFDKENRKQASPDLFMPKPLHFSPDKITQEVMDLVKKRFGNNFGALEPFWFAVTKSDAEKQLKHFLKKCLPFFGDFQDAMLVNEPFLYHSLLSLYINVGLLDPLDICRQAEKEYFSGKAPLNAVEGFIRQIIGWREYVRGIYWTKMPSYSKLNFFEHTRPLPEFYWSGETLMMCLKSAITQTKNEAYAHHIQRLMVTGNFGLLAGLDPKVLHEWYLAVYVDAFEWVELPNTIGMSQFADGGMLASKPYVSGGNYINKMSNYCENCSYDVKKREGPSACPFNSLYWDFVDRHEKKLSKNLRMAQMYATWRRMAEEDKKAIRKKAQTFLQSLK